MAGRAYLLMLLFPVIAALLLLPPAGAQDMPDTCLNASCCQWCGDGIVGPGEECEPSLGGCPDTVCGPDGCIGNDYYLFGTASNACLPDCTCENNVCGPPEISYNDPRCTECQDDGDCDHLDRDYCSGNTLMHDNGKCSKPGYACVPSPGVVEYCDDRDGAAVGDCGEEDWWCDPNSNQCEIQVIGLYDSLCDNGFFCDGAETCVDAFCVAGAPVDCSGSDIQPIAECFYNPDSNPYTWDLFPGFTSFCNEATDSCETGSMQLTHACDMQQCSAECVSAPADCPPKCTAVSHKLYTQVDCTGCLCEYSNYKCVVGECGALCDEDGDCPCPADECVGSDFYDYPDHGYCGTAGSEGCLCQTNVLASGQCLPVIEYGSAKCCVPSAEVCDGIDNDCDGQVDEGGGALCDDGAWCNGDEVCLGSGGCAAGTPVDCNDYIGCTIDSCNEETDFCEYAPDNSYCDDGNYCNGIETCSIYWGGCWPGTPVDCSGNDIGMIGECLWDPDSNPFTWDFFPGFTSTCDESQDSCTTGGISLTHACNITLCGAECEDKDDCSMGLGDDICYYQAVCDACSCSYDQEPCPEPGTVHNGTTCYYGNRSCDDSGCGLDECILKNPVLDRCDPVDGCVECVYAGTIIDSFDDGSYSRDLVFPDNDYYNREAMISFNFSSYVILSANVDVSGLPLTITSKGMADTALVEDISGSMDDDCGPDGVAQPGETPCKINDKKAADLNFVNTLLGNNGNNTIGLVAYSTAVVDSVPLSSNATLLASRINAYQAGGTTCISCGIDEGIKILSSGSNTNRVMVLLSDGKANECMGGICTLEEARNEAIAKAQEAGSLNITIHAIAYGYDADVPTMQQIASEGHGKYYFADNLNISEIYGQLANDAVQSYTFNPEMDVGWNGLVEWSHAGAFNATSGIDFTQELASLAAGCSCPGCNLSGDGECVIGMEAHSEQPGRLLLDNLNVTACTYLPIAQSCIDADNDTYYAYDAVFCVDGNDCDDGNAAVHPGAQEICNSRDDDCDGSVDEGLVCGQSNDGNGGHHGSSGGITVYSCTQDWNCTEWTACQPDGTRERECFDENDCGDDDGRPAETENCTYVPPEAESVCSSGARMCADGGLLECANGSGWELVEACEYGCNASLAECNPMTLSFENGGPITTSDGLTGMMAASRDVLYGLLALVLIVLVALVVWKKRRKRKGKKQ